MLYAILFMLAELTTITFFWAIQKLTTTHMQFIVATHMFDMLYGFVFGMAWCRGFITTECSKCKKLIPGLLDDETTPLMHA